MKTSTKGIPDQLVTAASSALARRTSRRGFLARTTMASSAIVAAPTDFILKANTAQQALCRCQGQLCDCGSTCCGGYTEFCCTMSGENKCPPGTLLGGWWKADGTSYCGAPGASTPRYYMDCNSPCGNCSCGSSGVCRGSCTGDKCECALGNCNNRKTGCTHFRYGQCNQDTACIGPIMCRVVTCQAPWTLDQSCGTSSATDQRTATHHRPCLIEENPFGALDHVDETGRGFLIRGWAHDPEISQSAKVNITVDGQVVATLAANKSRPDVAQATGTPENVGFDTYLNLTPGKHKVCAVVRNGDGESVQLGCRTVVTGRPYGEVEVLRPAPGGILVRGWAIDPGRDQPPRIHIWIDGQRRAVAPATVRRNRIAGLYGFSPTIGFHVKVRIPPGEHRVSVWAVNDDGRPHRRLKATKITLP